jgi:hypothetical protein
VGVAVKVLLRFSERVAPEKCHGMICSEETVPEFWFRDLPDAQVSWQYSPESTPDANDAIESN